MGRISLAFKVLFNGDLARRVEDLLVAPTSTPAVAPAVPATPRPEKKAPARSEALTLLSVLQREGRLIDFLKEPITTYTDAQVGAAVRDLHRDCGQALDRLFALKPVEEKSEGAEITIPKNYDANRTRLVGNVSGTPPHHGRLQHQGWQATKTELPEWNGPPTATNIIAPAEVEIP